MSMSISSEIAFKIKEYIKEQKNNQNYIDLVFVCIGTDRMTGDSLGPIVGSKLREILERHNISNINVYGVLGENVSYTNINKTLENVMLKHKNAYIIAIDSALGKKEDIGKVIISNEKMHIGKGLNKRKIELGDISIKAIVAKNSKIPNNNFYILQNVSLYEVMNLSDIVVKGIVEAILN